MPASNPSTDTLRSPVHTSRPPTGIVGVGASAGGLMAIRKFISEIQSLPNTALVIIQHLRLEHVSLMDQLIKGYTNIPVKFAEPGPIEANTIYLNSGNFNIVVKDGHFVKLDRDKTDDNYFFPINLFFNSIAHEYGAHATGIILTGTGTDGSVGIVAIKEFGGMVMVQDPSHAEFNGMPEAALSHNVHDFVLSATDLGRQINKMYSGDLAKVVTEVPLQPELEERGDEIFDRYVRSILLEVKRRLGIDFLSYKNSTIHRRIIKHIFITESEDIAAYYEKILHDTKELQNLAQGFLIRVTRFYRDASVWDSIKENVIPILLERAKGRQLRIFSAACSTGDEAYTLAMVLDEAARAANQVIDVKIFATDLDAEALAIANVGTYAKSSLEELPHKYIKDYFNLTAEGLYKINDKLRSQILFAKHDLVKDPPFINVDLILCRNLFIYLKQEEQASLLTKFHFGLKDNSFLVLGRTESITNVAKDLFQSIDESNRIFKNRSTALRRFRNIKPLRPMDTPVEREPIQQIKEQTWFKLKPSNQTAMKTTTHYGESSQLFMHYSEIVLKVLGKPAMVLSEDLDILFMFGELGHVVKQQQGIPSPAVAASVKASLVPVIKDGVSSSIEAMKTVQFDGVVVSEVDDLVLSLMFVPQRSEVLDTTLVLLVIDDSLPVSVLQEVQKVAPDEVIERKYRVMESELQKTKLTLQSTVEELETTNEELQASNEELLAANEELQSANEELQSVNEELYSVNTEMQEKMVELGNLHSDIDSMIQSTDLGVLFLDADLRVRKITPKAMTQFNFTEHDEGRSITDFTMNFKMDNLLTEINRSRSEVRTIEQMVYNEKLKQDFILRITPHRRNVMNRQVIEGAVLAFIDVSPTIRGDK